MARSSRSPGKQHEQSNLVDLMIAALSVILVAAVLICAGLLAVPLWAALAESWQSPSITPELQRVN
jgi:hypothetical protein